MADHADGRATVAWMHPERVIRGVMLRPCVIRTVRTIAAPCICARLVSDTDCNEIFESAVTQQWISSIE